MERKLAQQGNKDKQLDEEKGKVTELEEIVKGEVDYISFKDKV